MRIKIKTDNKSIREYLFLIGVLLLVIIPKGGFKISGIPLTWGYFYLGLLFGISLLVIGYVKKFTINYKHLLSYLATLPFVLYFIISLQIRGYDGTFGNLMSIYINFIFIPLLFYIILSYFLKKIDPEYIDKLIRNGVFIVSLYGIFLFIFKQTTGHYLEIPYFTVNASDLGELEDKYNQRGDIFKLISTYNNGNIFGVCMLMFFPMFFSSEKSKIKIGIVIIALILTLSRTVWIGLAIFFIIKNRQQLVQLVKVYLLFGIIMFFFSSIVLSKYFQYGSLFNFITDANLGGRIAQIRKLDEITLFGYHVYSEINEIVYLSILRQFGIVGLLLYCFSFFVPALIYFSTKNNRKVYMYGVILYLIISMSDGCVLYIPTLVFFYFVSTIALMNYKKTAE